MGNMNDSQTRQLIMRCSSAERDLNDWCKDVKLFLTSTTKRVKELQSAIKSLQGLLSDMRNLDGFEIATNIHNCLELVNTAKTLMENGKDTLKHGFREIRQNILERDNCKNPFETIVYCKESRTFFFRTHYRPPRTSNGTAKIDFVQFFF